MRGVDTLKSYGIDHNIIILSKARSSDDCEIS